MLPKVSIILPVYNAEKTIERCVGSIVNQEYKDFELILVNDGSNDSTGGLCDKWAGNDPRVRVIHKENSGVSDSRNLALEEACGEYLQFVDSDDWLSPEATGCFVETAERYQCDLVISDFYRVAGDRKSHKGNIHEEGPFSLETYAAYMMEKPADFYYGVLWNKLYRREIVERYGLRMDSSVSWCEDFMFNLEYLRYAKVFCAVQIPLYYYVKNKNSLSTQGMSLSNTVKMKGVQADYIDAKFALLSPEERELYLELSQKIETGIREKLYTRRLSK